MALSLSLRLQTLRPPKTFYAIKVQKLCQILPQEEGSYKDKMREKTSNES